MDIKFIRDNLAQVKQGCKNKNVIVDLDQLLVLDDQRRKLIKQIEENRARQNQFSKEIVKLTGIEKETEIKSMKGVAEQNAQLTKQLNQIADSYQQLLNQVPNLPLAEVKIGKDESDNEILSTYGKIPKFGFSVLDHQTLGEQLDLIDTKRASKVSGNRFSYFKNELVILQFAIIQLVLNKLTNTQFIQKIINKKRLALQAKSFVPMITPHLIKEESMRAMGYMDRGSEEIYRTAQDNLFLIGTSEQSIGPFHQGEILTEEQLPKRYLGFSPCYRREAGSYGKDVQGILRLHQFDKLEMFSFCLPAQAKEEHQLILGIEEALVQLLAIPYHVLNICTGDLGTPAASKYDIECWMPSQNKYRETHSCSNCTDWQSRRLNIRYRNQQTNNNEFVYTLNGTAFALGRIMIAIMENYQQRDGSIKIPKVLQSYTGFKRIKK